MRSVLRWLVAAGVAVGGSALCWWVAERFFQLDRPIAVSVAAVIGLLLAAPFAWYASRVKTELAPQAMHSSRHVFISYRHSFDAEYAERLAAHLTAVGIPAFIDREINTGTRWNQVIKEQVASSAALVVVMTPEAEESEWVIREIAEAQRAGRPIVPILLRGTRFYRLSQLQHETVTGGQMPSRAFLDRLRALLPPATGRTELTTAGDSLAHNDFSETSGPRSRHRRPNEPAGERMGGLAGDRHGRQGLAEALLNTRHPWLVLPALGVAIIVTVAVVVAVGYRALAPSPGRNVADQSTESGGPAASGSAAPASATPASAGASAAPSASATSKPCTPQPTTIKGQTRAASIPGRTARIAVNYTGKQLAASTNDETVLLYEVSNPACPTRMASIRVPANAGRLSFSPSRNLLAISNYIGGKGTVTLYDTTNLAGPKKVGSFEGGNSAFNANGKLMAFGGSGNTTVIFDVSNPASPSRGASVGGSGTVEFSPARDLLATTDLGAGGVGTAVNLYSITNPSSPTKLGTITNGDQPFAVAFSSNANLLAIATWQKTVTLWNIANPAAPARITSLGYAEMVTDLAFSPTRSTVATASLIPSLDLLGASTAGFNLLAQLPDGCASVAFQPQGGFLVCSGPSTSLYTLG